MASAVVSRASPPCAPVAPRGTTPPSAPGASSGVTSPTRCSATRSSCASPPSATDSAPATSESKPRPPPTPTRPTSNPYSRWKRRTFAARGTSSPPRFPSARGSSRRSPTTSRAPPPPRARPSNDPSRTPSTPSSPSRTTPAATSSVSRRRRRPSLTRRASRIVEASRSSFVAFAFAKFDASATRRWRGRRRRVDGARERRTARSNVSSRRFATTVSRIRPSVARL